MRDRDRDEGCVRAGLPRRSPSPLSPLAPFPSTCAARRFLVDIRESAWMWVSVLRAKVKPVARVVEVGRIRVTDQRAPREPAPGKPPRCGTARRRLRRGPGSHRERVSRAKLALGVPDYLPACLSSFLPSSFLRSFLSVSPSRRTIFSCPPSFPRASLSPSPFTNILPFPSRRSLLRLSCVHGFPSFSVVRARYAFYHIPLCPLFSKPLSLPFSIPSLCFPFVPPFVPLASSFFARSPPDISDRCLPASDYLVLGTGYSVLGTRYPVYSPDHHDRRTHRNGATPP